MVSLKSVDCHFVWRFLCLNAAPAQIISDIQIFFINYINFHFNGSISSHNNLAHAKGAASVLVSSFKWQIAFKFFELEVGRSHSVCNKDHEARAIFW